MVTTSDIRIRVSAEGAGDAAGEIDQVGESAGRLPGALSGAGTALLGFAGLGAGIGALFTAGLMGNISAADANAKLTAQLGLTQGESQRIGGVAGDLYSSAYGESMDEVNSAVATVMTSIEGMSTASDADLKAATATALDFATTFDTDVAEGARLAGIAVKTGLAADSTEAFNLMTAAAQKAGPDMAGPVMEAAGEYSTFFSALGFSGEQAFGALSAAAVGGEIQIDKTGDAIKEFGIRATDGSSTTVAAFDLIGVNAGKMANDLLAGGDTAASATQSIIDGLLSVKDPAAQSQAAIALFGTPLEDIGVDKVPQFLAALSSADGGMGNTATAAADMSAAINSGPGVALEEFKRKAQGALVGLTDWALPPLMSLVGVLTDRIPPAAAAVGAAFASMAGFVQEHSLVFQVVAGFILGMLLPALTVMAVQSTVTAVTVVAAWVMQQVAAAQSAAAQVVAHTQTMAGWIAAAARAVASAAVVVASWVLMGAQALLAAARMAAAWLIAMGPVGIVIAIVIALVALIIANWDTIKRVTIQVWDAIVAKVQEVWAAITSWVSGAIERVRTVISTVMAAIQALWTAYWTAVRAVAQSILDAIVAFVASAIARVMGAVQRVQEVVGVVRAAFSRAKDAATEMLGNLVSTVASIPGRITGALGNLGNLLRDKGRQLIQGLIGGITSMIGNVGSAMSGITSKIKGFLPGSPVKEGPLTSWNRGGAGKRLGGMLADGLDASRRTVAAAASQMAAAASVSLPSPTLGSAIAGGVSGPSRASGGGAGVQGSAVGGAGTTISLTTYYPINEPASQALNRGLQTVGNLGLG